MAASVPSPESRARIERLERALLDTVSRCMQAEGVTPPEAQTAVGHMYATLICHLGVQDSRSPAEIQTQAEHVARRIVQAVRHHVAAGP